MSRDQTIAMTKNSGKSGDELVEKYPHNVDVQMIHAVRIGFCEKVEDGSIDFETARDVINVRGRMAVL